MLIDGTSDKDILQTVDRRLRVGLERMSARVLLNHQNCPPARTKNYAYESDSIGGWGIAVYVIDTGIKPAHPVNVDRSPIVK